MPDLIVWLGDEEVGEIVLSGRRSAVFRPSRANIGLSVGAPDDGSAWSAEFTRSWFDNVLPEEEPRRRTAGRFGLRADDSWGLLAEVGWECAGAVAVLPPDVTPKSGSYEPVTDDGLWDRLAALPARPYDRDAALRLSLGGAQNKLLVTRTADGWKLPIDGAPSTHILKPEPPWFPGLSLAEAWSLEVASAATPAAEATVLECEGHAPTLAVRRFDRRLAHDGRIVRDHQEDFCQVLGLAPTAKYASHPMNPRLPSYLRIAEALRRRASRPEVELARLLEQTVVNVAVANTDAHAKNHAVFHQPGNVIRLTPMYDVAPTIAFIDQRHVGLPISGKFVLADIGRGHLIREAETWDVPAPIARDTIDRVLDALMAVGVPEADAAYPLLDPRIRDIAVASIRRLAAS
jgi:serine/threonine-protein kinase HipA